MVSIENEFQLGESYIVKWDNNTTHITLSDFLQNIFLGDILQLFSPQLPSITTNYATMLSFYNGFVLNQ